MSIDFVQMPANGANRVKQPRSIEIGIPAIVALCISGVFGYPQTTTLIGREIAIPIHLRDGQEYDLSASQLIQYGEKLFSAGGPLKRSLLEWGTEVIHRTQFSFECDCSVSLIFRHAF